MAKVQSAANAIEIELKEARQAVAFYTRRIEDLEDILATLASIDAPSTSRGKGTGKKAATRAQTAKPAASASKGARSTKLPPTGKDFWPGLLTDTPQSSAQVFKAAIAALRIRPNPEDRKKLSQRMANALSTLAKNGDINAEGDRRTRLYSRKPA